MQPSNYKITLALALASLAAAAAAVAGSSQFRPQASFGWDGHQDKNLAARSATGRSY